MKAKEVLSRDFFARRERPRLGGAHSPTSTMKYRAASVVISSEWDKNIKISFRNVPGLFRTSSNAYRFDATRVREPKAEQAGETRCDSTFAVYADRTYPKTYPGQFSSKLCIPTKSLTLQLRDLEHSQELYGHPCRKIKARKKIRGHKGGKHERSR